MTRYTFFAGVVLCAALGLGGESAVLAEAGEGDLQCSCRACEPDVCCGSPSGFAPLDQKCADKCVSKRWAVKSHENCAPQPGCCPERKAKP